MQVRPKDAKKWAVFAHIGYQVLIGLRDSVPSMKDGFVTLEVSVDEKSVIGTASLSGKTANITIDVSSSPPGVYLDYSLRWEDYTKVREDRTSQEAKADMTLVEFIGHVSAFTKSFLHAHVGSLQPADKIFGELDQEVAEEYGERVVTFASEAIDAILSGGSKLGDMSKDTEGLDFQPSVRIPSPSRLMKLIPDTTFGPDTSIIILGPTITFDGDELATVRFVARPFEYKAPSASVIVTNESSQIYVGIGLRVVLEGAGLQTISLEGTIKGEMESPNDVARISRGVIGFAFNCINTGLVRGSKG